jgi:hypothetical protein
MPAVEPPQLGVNPASATYCTAFVNAGKLLKGFVSLSSHLNTVIIKIQSLSSHLQNPDLPQENVIED